jgi:hypothetical protein
MTDFVVSDFDVDAFVSRLEGMGMKLTVVPLADGRFRITRWCMMSANEHAQQIQELWKGQIGDDQGRIDVLAVHLARKTPREAFGYVSSTQPQQAVPQPVEASDVKAPDSEAA